MAIFKKLSVGDTVATSGTRVFKKLTTEEPTPSKPVWDGTDLTGTTWLVRAGWTVEAEYGGFDIDGNMFTYWAEEGLLFTKLGMGYRYYDTEDGKFESSAADRIYFVYTTDGGTGTDNDGDINFTFTGGIDSTNERFINWLLENGELTSHRLQAGLYDANDNLVASWDTLVNTYGMGVEKDYNYSTYKTDTASPYYVLTNNSELATGTKLVIPNGVTSIGSCAFLYCSNLVDVTIPDSVTTIGWEAFSHCTSLTNAIIPDSVTDIKVNTSLGSAKKGTFYDCTSLISVTIGKRVTSIVDKMFSDCTSLSSVTIPDSTTSIGDFAFSRCTSLTSITIPNSVTSIGNNVFRGCTSLTSITIPNSVTSIGESVCNGCTALASVTIQNGVTDIGAYTFYSCTALTSITIPNSVTSIGDGVFNSCTNLSIVTIGNGVTSIGDDAFRSCAFTSITIPDSVTSIGYGAFLHCKALTSITIPNSLTSIGNSVFYGCSGLADVYFKGTAEQWAAITIGENNTELTNATIHYNWV